MADPRVTCDGCAHAWYGETAAHGLRIVGSCPRCGGELRFLVDDEPERELAGLDALRTLAPAEVLGAPTSWLR